MEDIKPVNTKQESDCGFVAGINGKKAAFYAPSLYAAKCLAEKHFKVSRKNLGLLWVTLAEDKNGNVVTQSTVI